MLTGLLTGYIGIMLVLFLTGCGLPVPEELPIVTAGVLSRTGTLFWPIALACCILGALAGDSAMYWIGNRFGRSVLRDHPWWVGFLTPEREKKAEYLIRNHGPKLLFIVRFLPGLRLPVYLTMGILKMPFKQFLLIDLLCATIVVGAFFGLGYFFGEQIMHTIQTAERGLLIGVGVLAAAFLLFYIVRSRRRMAQLKMVAALCDSNVGQRAPTVQNDEASPVAEDVAQAPAEETQQAP